MDAMCAILQISLNTKDFSSVRLPTCLKHDVSADKLQTDLDALMIETLTGRLID
jgi:hypothetical protein